MVMYNRTDHEDDGECKPRSRTKLRTATKRRAKAWQKAMVKQKKEQLHEKEQRWGEDSVLRRVLRACLIVGQCPVVVLQLSCICLVLVLYLSCG